MHTNGSTKRLYSPRGLQPVPTRESKVPRSCHLNNGTLTSARLMGLTHIVVLVILGLLMTTPSQADPPGTYTPEWPPCEAASITPAGTCWVPDLTDFGIEPNPGPVTTSTPQSRQGKGKKVKTGTTVVKIIPQPAPKMKRQPPPPRRITGRDVGASIGGWVGDMAQKAIQTITGFGDYRVRGNTLVNGGSPPAFQQGKHYTKVCHREFVGLVSSPGSAFAIQGYGINPSSSFFPWLSEIALSFEQFAFRGLVVEFKSTSGTSVASTNTALGSVIIATQYNVLAPAFTTQQQMEAYEFCTSCAPDTSMIHPVECLPALNSETILYVDTGFGGDPRLNYLGTTYVATVGQQAASVIGELWTSYEIDLIRPKLFSGIANTGYSAHWQNANTGSFATISNALGPLNGLTPSAGSDFPATISNNQLVVSGGLTGTYLVMYNISWHVIGTSLTLTYLNGVTVTSGSAQVINTWGVGMNTVGGTPPTPINQAIVSGSNSYTSGFAAVVTFSGTNPGVNTILDLGSWNQTGTTGSITVNLYITGLSTNQ